MLWNIFHSEWFSKYVVNFILEYNVQTWYYTIGLNNFATAKSQKLGMIQKGVQEFSRNHVYPRNTCTFQETFKRLHKPEHRIHRAWWCSHWFSERRNGETVGGMSGFVKFPGRGRPWKGSRAPGHNPENYTRLARETTTS